MAFDSEDGQLALGAIKFARLRAILKAFTQTADAVLILWMTVFFALSTESKSLVYF